jgi:hypothetical protein
MVVPPYCRSGQGRLFRVQRFSEQLGPDRMRYVLRATPIRIAGQAQGVEASREIDTAQMRDKILRRQVVPTPEETFEQLWQQLRLDLDSAPA